VKKESSPNIAVFKSRGAPACLTQNLLLEMLAQNVGQILYPKHSALFFVNAQPPMSIA